MDGTNTPVSAELRAVQCEVDTFYRDNALLSLSRSQAMWYLLAECEEWFFRRHARGDQPLKPGSSSKYTNLRSRFTESGSSFQESGGFPMPYYFKYSSILKAIWAFSAIHSFARCATRNRGLHAAGYRQSLVMMERGELTARLHRYLDLDPITISDVIADLTFGDKGVENPDLALQPLVPMGVQHLGWAPSLVLSSSLERNLLVLLNRLPQSKETYSRLAEQLEVRMRDSFIRTLTIGPWTLEWYQIKPLAGDYR